MTFEFLSVFFKKKSILFFVIFSWSFSVHALNENTCKNISVKNKIINISGINISPNSKVGDALSNVTDNTSEVGECTSPTGVQSFLYHMPGAFISNGLATYNGENVTFTHQNTQCNVYNTNTAGIGIVWFNYNSGSSSWMCVNTNIRRGLPNNSNSSNKITDTVVLVRTGDIHPGSFDYNISLGTYIVDGAGNSPDPGQDIAYSIDIKAAKTEIKVGDCDISYDKEQLKFSNIPLRSITSKGTKLNNGVSVSLNCSGGFVPNVVYIKALTSGNYSGDTGLALSTNNLAGLALLSRADNTQINYGSQIPVSINGNIGEVDFIPSIYSQKSDARLLNFEPIVFNVGFSLY